MIYGNIFWIKTCASRVIINNTTLWIYCKQRYIKAIQQTWFNHVVLWNKSSYTSGDCVYLVCVKNGNSVHIKIGWQYLHIYILQFVFPLIYVMCPKKRWCLCQLVCLLKRCSCVLNGRKLMLTHDEWGPVTFTWGQCDRKYAIYQSQKKCVWKLQYIATFKFQG